MIPNLITLCRLALVPFVIAMLSKGEFALAFYGFGLAGLSDAVDGYVARKFDMRTELGAYLDAIADKVVCNSVLPLVPNLEGAIREITRICKPGALVYLGEIPQRSAWNQVRPRPGIWSRRLDERFLARAPS